MSRIIVFLAFIVPGLLAHTARADVPLGGFIPFVGIGLTDEFKNANTGVTGTFFLADPELSLVGAPLSGGGSPYYDIALVDTGAATHIFTPEAAGPNGFDIEGNGFDGTNIQQVGGATGLLNLEINDPLAIFAAGLGHRTSAGTSLAMNTGAFRGQSSVATLTAPTEWTLPNILGLPMAAHHAIHIKNSDPQLFTLNQRTVRTPQVDFIDLGTGNQQGILRRTDLKIRPGASFIAGPLFIQNLDIFSGEPFHENPLSPSIVQSGALIIDVDLKNGSNTLEDKELLFDTGADLTVVSQLTAARLGFDPILDTPDFVLEVEGSGGISSGIPGFYLEELNIDTVGGTFTMQNVPIAVLDVTNPNDPGNTIDGILGMHLFTGRDLVVDANPSIGQGGAGPSLYIGDPVTETHTWTSVVPQTNWATAGNWAAAGVPGIMWNAQLINATLPFQFVGVTSDSTVFRLTVGATAGNNLELQITNNTTLTSFGEIRIGEGGEIVLFGGTSKVDAQFIHIEDGVLRGSGAVFVGTGPIAGAVRNLSGTVQPGANSGEMIIEGDYSSLEDARLLINLGGTLPVSQYTRLTVDRFAFLAGTLEVTLNNLSGGFVPEVGNMFTILTATEGVVGEFDALLLPADYVWDIDYLSTSVVLEFLGLPGDFNGDGFVLGDDLAAWETGFGAPYDGADFTTWQRKYQGAMVAGAAAVPEPGSGLLLLLGAVGPSLRMRRRLGKRH